MTSYKFAYLLRQYSGTNSVFETTFSVSLGHLKPRYYLAKSSPEIHFLPTFSVSRFRRFINRPCTEIYHHFTQNFAFLKEYQLFLSNISKISQNLTFSVQTSFFSSPKVSRRSAFFRKVEIFKVPGISINLLGKFCYS